MMKTDNQQIKLLVGELVFNTKSAFGERCKAIYIMGSLARGGFSEAASDIDLGVILAGPLDELDAEKIDKVQIESTEKFSSVKNTVSIFWGSVESINGVEDAGRYPPFDRLDLIDHALLLEGTEMRDQLIRPTKRELEMAGAEFALWYLGSEERVNEFLNCELMAGKGTVHITKTILFPARFLYLEKTGMIAGNDVSSEFYLNNFEGPDANLVERGCQWRLNSVPESTETISDTLKVGLIPLYKKFLDIYIGKMNEYGEQELANNLRQWRINISN